MTHAFDTREHSFFGTGTYQLPGTWLGGNVKIGIVAGTNSLELEAKPNAINPAPAKGKIGSAENDFTMYGGSILWFNKGTYVPAWSSAIEAT